MTPPMEVNKMATSNGWVLVLNHGDAHYLVGSRSVCGNVVSLNHEGRAEQPEAACPRCVDALKGATAEPEPPEDVEQPEKPTQTRKAKK